MAQTNTTLLKGLALAVAAFASIPVSAPARAETGARITPRIRAGKPSLRAGKQPKSSLRAAKKETTGKPAVRVQQNPDIRADKTSPKPGIRMKKSPQIRMTPGIRMRKAPAIRMKPGMRSTK